MSEVKGIIIGGIVAVVLISLGLGLVTTISLNNNFAMSDVLDSNKLDYGKFNSSMTGIYNKTGSWSNATFEQQLQEGAEGETFKAIGTTYSVVAQVKVSIGLIIDTLQNIFGIPRAFIYIFFTILVVALIIGVYYLARGVK